LSRTRLNWREIRRTFTFAEPLVGIAVAFLAPLGFALVGSFTTRMYRADLKLTEAQFGTLNGWVALVAGMTGALFGGALADRFGVRRTIGATMTAIAINMAVFGAVPHLWPSFGFLVAWYFAQSFCIAAYSAAKFKFAMTLCNPAIGATHFSIYMATTNLCYAFSSRPGGWMADHLGYSMTFYIAALIQVITIGILFFCDPRKAEARFRSTESTGSPHEAPQPAG
jgi:PAT family beta-lactamase induction signal transducer AmpG